MTDFLLSPDSSSFKRRRDPEDIGLPLDPRRAFELVQGRHEIARRPAGRRREGRRQRLGILRLDPRGAEGHLEREEYVPRDRRQPLEVRTI